jgi:hypothetical protein
MDKAMLYWTSEEMNRFETEYDADLEFRAMLKCVLVQKQKDQQRKEAEWRLNLQTKGESDEAKADSFYDRPSSDALAPPSCKRVHFISEEDSSPVLSVHEYPRAFKTLEDKALLHWSTDELKRFKMEYKAERRFREKLKLVLIQKQEDQYKREAEVWLELQMKGPLALATRRRVEDQLELERGVNSKRRRLNRR